MRSATSKRDARGCLDNNPNQIPVWPMYVIRSGREVNDYAQIGLNERDSDCSGPFVPINFAKLGGCAKHRIL